MKRICTYISFAFIASTIVGCSTKKQTLFRLLSSEETGISFQNSVAETDSFNILTYEYIYNGGGVATADFNNDGLVDIFFCGNLVSNRLYQNQGNLSFKDITEGSNVSVPHRWSSGASIVDINNDGWMDIYVCATAHPDSANRKNMLFVNQGIGSNGTPAFKEMAAQYKLDYTGYSVMSAFSDFDQDGDLDLYILTNVKVNNVPTNYRIKITDGSAINNDKLFRNEGNGTFVDFTKEAGINEEGFGLGLAVADFNKDGWPDIYVSNDYLSNDILYINQGNGTFKNLTSLYTSHQSQFSMGNDAADFNNDGLVDIVTLDMLPENNYRKKTTIGNKSYQNYINNEKFGYEYQYVRNMLHLNNGLNNGIKFSEVGQLAGMYQTEWSWSPLFVDVDNDGWKDLLITNGFPKDITDKDFANYRTDVGNIASPKYLIDSIPIVKIPNYAFKNNSTLSFKDVSQEWGLDVLSFSNASAFADLDNDGDMDYIINTINEPVILYENTLYTKQQQQNAPHYLNIKLSGAALNKQAVGAEVTLYSDSGKLQFEQLSPYRGFLSSVQPIIHFGLGSTTQVDSLYIKWPNGKLVKINKPSINQTITINYESGGIEVTQKKTNPGNKLFIPCAQELKLNYKHVEKDQIDYNTQRTLPHKFSQSGPGIAVGDITGDGLEDFVVGGSAYEKTSVFIQSPDGTFKRKDISFEKTQEDLGILLFDVDNDQDLDLYLVGGSLEPGLSLDIFKDRMLLNDGRGNFTPSTLPDTNASGSCVRAADYDGDGDLDLFVGGRMTPGAYPFAPESYLFKNNKGSLTSAADLDAPGIKNIGMVTDAIWTDYNSDGKIDLIVVGEFMPITFFKNVNAKLIHDTETNIENQKGWWNSIAASDFDQDGDMDYVAGNLGENNNYQVTPSTPLKVFAKDFDGNGSIDPIMACYAQASMTNHEKKLFPMHFWDELNSQSPLFRRKFKRYREYGRVTIDQLLSPAELNGAMVLEANNFSTSIIENLGNGKFNLKALETKIQVAPVNGLLIEDFNDDTYPDIAMVGNDFGNEVFAGRYDAFTGVILLGDGKCGFKLNPSSKSGFYVPGDAKGLVRLNDSKGKILIATQNQDSLKVFRYEQSQKILTPKAMDFLCELVFESGKKQRIEFNYGAGFLSQSSRSISIPNGVKEIIITDFQGNKRKVQP